MTSDVKANVAAGIMLLLALCLTGTAQRYLSSPDLVPMLVARVRGSQARREGDALAQVQREISWMEHGYGS